MAQGTWRQCAGHMSMSLSTCCAQLPAGQVWVFWGSVSSDGSVMRMVAEGNAVRISSGRARTWPAMVDGQVV
jgi:hypothetical protein